MSHHGGQGRSGHVEGRSGGSSGGWNGEDGREGAAAAETAGAAARGPRAGGGPGGCLAQRSCASPCAPQGGANGLRLTPAQAREAFGPHGHVAGLYVMVDPPRPGGSLWAMARAAKQGGRAAPLSSAAWAEGAGEGGGSSGGRGEGGRGGRKGGEGRGRQRRVLVVQECSVRGAAEWDAANRQAAGGVVERTRVVGSRVVMECWLGSSGRVRFGPSARQVGAQALESIAFEARGGEGGEDGQGSEGGSGEGSEGGSGEGGEGGSGKGGQGSEGGLGLRLRWRGLAGAGVGLAHGLARAPGVLWTDYPQVPAAAGAEGLKVGGNREMVVETVVPALTRLQVGVDDTDTPAGGATWELGLGLAARLEEAIAGLKVLDQRLVQLWPGVAEKTANCVALGLSVALPPAAVGEAREAVLEQVAEQATSPEAAVALYEGVKAAPAVVDYCRAARRERVSLKAARAVANHAKVVLEPLVGRRGLIGALAAVGGLDLGPAVAAVAVGAAARG